MTFSHLCKHGPQFIASSSTFILGLGFLTEGAQWNWVRSSSTVFSRVKQLFPEDIWAYICPLLLSSYLSSASGGHPQKAHPKGHFPLIVVGIFCNSGYIYDFIRAFWALWHGGWLHKRISPWAGIPLKVTSAAEIPYSSWEIPCRNRSLVSDWCGDFHLHLLKTLY